MAHLLNPPGMGTNSYQEVPWAKSNSLSDVRFRVGASTHWEASVNTGQDRAITIPVGSGLCCGVYDETDSPETLQFDTNTSGADRYDFYVATWDWVGNVFSPRKVGFRAIKGGTGLPGINLTTVVDPTKVNRIPGVQYDAVLGFVRLPHNAGVLAPANLASDLRVWGGVGGPFRTNTVTNRHLLDLPAGASIYPLIPTAINTVSSGWRSEGFSGWVDPVTGAKQLHGWLFNMGAFTPANQVLATLPAELWPVSRGGLNSQARLFTVPISDGVQRNVQVDIKPDGRVVIVRPAPAVAANIVWDFNGITYV